MALQHFSHRHPLVFVEKKSPESEKAYCSACGELISGPSFSCADCGFCLDKMCAEAPAKVNHPLHREHSLQLRVSLPYRSFCGLCEKILDKFAYRNRVLDLHIKCALLSKSIAEKGFGMLEDVPQKDALVSVENFPEKANDALCCACSKWSLDSAYFDLGNGILLHKKCLDLPLEINHFLHTQHSLILQFNTEYLPCQICRSIRGLRFVYCCSPCKFAVHISCIELPTKINHLCHRNHPLFLQSNSESLPCKICQKTQDQGFVYSCSTCKISLHVNCATPPAIVKGEIHEHPFTLFWKRVPFICDACGTEGICASYTCSKCSLTVHKGCISLPRILRFPRHRHRLSHTFVLGQHEIKTRKCEACPEEVNAEHGVYCCDECDYIVHANCAKQYSWFSFDESEDADEQLKAKSAFVVIKETELGEDTAVASEIKHTRHQHNLVLSDDSEGDKVCDGCISSISTSFYYCSQCDFYFHRSCAESPLKKYLWFHFHQRPLILTLAGRVFRCRQCRYQFYSGFAYKCRMCDEDYSYFCLACALVSDTPTLPGHEHRLSYYESKRGLCSGCGDQLDGAFTCRDCNFAVDWKCLRLPNNILHRCDDHPLILTYHEDNLYSKYNYCDVCERRKEYTNQSFYHCAMCRTSAHRQCAVKEYTFMKLGGSYRLRNHPHSVTFTRSISTCHMCHQPCLDLSLECLHNGCDYIVHWDCITSSLQIHSWDSSYIRREDAGTS
ncbi:putative Cysteine/Histidine-rich C1 domain family protein [Hibiscus syriacus]|uniref:Cysteine/Histidine-rich C1 domain family protein n=1 Tax=Hibiscus syriacus TaxID=106335 RepID=A0A6A2Z4G2_HIBSY|nr:uncharacterized protein LOC120151811 [Hibiscus syriacus]KAE8686319.1 putative Cysteine/Histidine-rich C1 domain family protein [Hibiscus syriacus]